MARPDLADHLSALLARAQVTRPRLGCVLPLLLLMLSVSVGLPAQTGWPCFQGPRGNSTSPETGLLKTWPKSGPKVCWSVEVGMGYGGAAVRDGEVFVFDRIQGEGDVLRVLDLETGAEKWRWRSASPGRLPYPGSRTVPTVEAGHVYVTGGFGQVHCIDRKTHKPVWRVHLVEEMKGVKPGFGYVQSPLVHEKLVILTPLAPDAGIVALDRFTGKRVWATEGLGTSHTTPTLMRLGGVTQVVFLSAKGVPIGGRSVRIPGETKKKTDRRVRRALRGKWPEGTGSLRGFDVTTGKTLWHTDAYFCWQPVCGPIQIDETRVFLTGGYRSGSMMIDVSKNARGKFRVRPLFQNPRGSHIHAPILHDKHLFILVNETFNNRGRRSQREGGLMCMDLEGREIWRTGAKPFFGLGHMLKADGVLYLQDGHSGILRVVKPTAKGYEQLAKANVFGTKRTHVDRKMWAPMALADGRLIMRSQDKMLCVDLRASRQEE